MPPPPTSSSSTSSVISPPPSSTSSSTAPPPPPPSSTNVAGMLRVEVMSARNLHAAVLGSLLKWTPNYSNPYVVVTLHRDEFITTTKDKTLNPTWKEMGQLKVPLPTEQELLQTVGIHRSVHGVGLGYPVNDPSSKQKLGSSKLSSGSGSGAGGLDTGDFQACYPQLKVQVYHQSDEGTSGSPSRAQQQNQPQSATPQRRPTDKLIGEVIVPVLPCLLSSTSSSRAWYTLLSDEHPEAGQIQIALHYDVGGLEPLKGDIVRFAGFGGMEYYAKLVNANARLDVIDMFQDQVVVQVKSIEGWLLSFEVHRNLLFVVRRPSMLRDAQSQLQGQIVRVRHSPLVTKAHNVWQSIPAGQRRQLQHLYELVVFSGGAVYTVVNASVHTAMNDGVKAGIKSCVNGSSEAVNQVSLEAVRLFWADESSRRPRKSPAQDAVFHLEGGPLAGRGKIVSGFDGGKFDSNSTQLALYDRHGDEEKTADDEYVVEPDEDTVDAEEEGDADGEADSEQDRSNVHSEYDDEEKTNEDDASGHWLEDCPDQLICPITGCPMIDPVVAADGHSYEREAILQWFATSNKSPMTGAQMPTTQVFPNFTLRKLSEEFQSKMRPRK